MSERTRTDWKGKHDALVIQVAQLEQMNEKSGEERGFLQVQVDELEAEVVELKKQVERARLQGMNDVTALLLRDGQ